MGTYLVNLRITLYVVYHAGVHEDELCYSFPEEFEMVRGYPDPIEIYNVAFREFIA